MPSDGDGDGEEGGAPTAHMKFKMVDSVISQVLHSTHGAACEAGQLLQTDRKKVQNSACHPPFMTVPELSSHTSLHHHTYPHLTVINLHQI